MKFYGILLIIVLGFLAYANSIKGELIRDDYVLIKNNPHIRSIPSALNFFTTKAAIGGRQKWSSYRPFQIFTYALDYSVWKLNLKGYHLTNIILHILASLAVYGLISIISRSGPMSLFAAALFVVNPLHTEAVSYMSGRADSLAALFMLVTFILYIKKMYIPMLLTYALAILSRENSLILPALILVYHYSFGKKGTVPKRGQSPFSLSLFSLCFLAAIYALLRVTLLKGLFSDVTVTSTFLQRIPGFFVAITTYAKLLILPINLHTAYGVKLFSMMDPRAVFGALIFGALLIYAVRKKQADGLVTFSILWFFVALIPQSNLYPLNAYMAEHWLYIPSIGFFLLLAKAISRWRVFVVIFVAFYTILTINQNSYWKDPLTFYTRTLKYAPDDYGEHVNLGLTYVELGRMTDARRAFERSLEINPRYADGHYNLGKLEYERGEWEASIALFEKAVRYNPKHAEAYHNLGNAYNDIGQRAKAVAAYKRTLDINPYYADSYYSLGNIYVELGDLATAERMYLKALEINPNDTEVRYNLSVVRHHQRR